MNQNQQNTNPSPNYLDEFGAMSFPGLRNAFEAERAIISNLTPQQQIDRAKTILKAEPGKDESQSEED